MSCFFILTFERLSTQLFSRHNLNEHYNGKLFDCHCGSVFKVKYQLKKHQKVHKEKEECKVCRKQLAFISIKQHWRKFHLETHGRLETRKGKFCGVLVFSSVLPAFYFRNRENSKLDWSLHLRQMWLEVFKPSIISGSS